MTVIANRVPIRTSGCKRQFKESHAMRNFPAATQNANEMVAVACPIIPEVNVWVKNTCY